MVTVLEYHECHQSVSHNCFYYTSKPECATIPDDNSNVTKTFHMGVIHFDSQVFQRYQPLERVWLKIFQVVLVQVPVKYCMGVVIETDSVLASYIHAKSVNFHIKTAAASLLRAKSSVCLLLTLTSWILKLTLLYLIDYPWPWPWPWFTVIIVFITLQNQSAPSQMTTIHNLGKGISYNAWRDVMSWNKFGGTSNSWFMRRSLQQTHAFLISRLSH